MKYLSVCSGIEAASVAWHPLGFEPVAFSEISKFPSAVLAHHYPHVPNLGDMTKFMEWPDADFSILVGGTPCQSFSVAGLRGGMADPRGNLALVYLAIAHRYRPRWLVFENVPGILSASGGRDFGSLLGGMVELGYGFAYRVLDAAHFGLAQRRKRVFVVGCLGDWRRAAAVLFEPTSLCGDSPPSRKAREDIAGTLDASFGRLQGCSGQDMNHGHSHLVYDAAQITSSNGSNPKPGDPYLTLLKNSRPLLASTVGSKWAKGTGGYAGQNETENCVIVPINELAYALGSAPAAHTSHGESQCNYVVHGTQTPITNDDTAFPIGRNNGRETTLMRHGIRRLAPEECEALQGFPRGYTRIPARNKTGFAKDAPRYMAIGNSMATNVMSWLGKRLKAADQWT